VIKMIQCNDCGSMKIARYVRCVAKQVWSRGELMASTVEDAEETVAWECLRCEGSNIEVIFEEEED